MDQPLLTVNQICKQLNTTRRNVELLRRKGLPYLMLGDSPRFDYGEVVAWMKRQREEKKSKLADHVFD